MAVQMLTFRVVVQGETNPLQGARITAVHLINLNRVLSIPLHLLPILPDIFIWTTKPQACQWTESEPCKAEISVILDLDSGNNTLDCN